MAGPRIVNPLEGNIPEGVRLEEGPGGLRRIAVATTSAEAVVYLHGAHVAHYQPAGEEPVLWMSRQSSFEPGKPFRGGIPVCFPWFGRHPTEPGQPIHGLARLREWAVDSVETDASTAEIELSLVMGPGEPQAPGLRVELRLSALIGPSLRVSLGVENRAASPLTFTEALHSYFAVSDIRGVRVFGLEGHPYVETAQQANHPGRDEGSVEFTGEVDRRYPHTPGACVIEDPGMRRRIGVAKEGSDSTIVWNPWTHKAKEMPDFGDNEWQEMVCVETANCRDDSVTLQPGQSHRMTATIAVERT